ncbi:MAG: PEP-CTERM sorting domain-containing protein [Acidobacteriota bacterium]|nr:PEP-CTERM sorting domain-containing protein [Acidobacteriota bacterium]
MRNLQFRLILSTVTLFSILTVTLTANAAPVKFEQVRQLINAKPGKAKTSAFARLSLINSEFSPGEGGDDKDKKDDKNKGTATPTTEQERQQDNRVITETTSEIVQDDVCDCVQDIAISKPGFPKYALLGLAAIPLLFLIPRGNKDTPTPTPPTTTTETPTPTTETPTPTPTTPTPTPPTTVTPTPPPQPVPEPVTILLFGTGLASVGMAARKKFGKKAKEKTEE